MIHGYVGRMGHGKTMRMTVDASLEAKRRGALLASNITIVPPVGVEFRLLPMEGFAEAFGNLVDECREREIGLVLAIDEVHMVWNARRWDEMTLYDQYMLTQSRHLGIDVFWTAQYVDQVEKTIRNITEDVLMLRAFPKPTNARFERGKRPWFIVGQRFRPAAVRELAAEQDRDKRLERIFYRYRRTDEERYDTMALLPPPRVEARRRAKRAEFA